MVVPDRRTRKLAYKAHFDGGLEAPQIKDELIPTYSLRTVQLLLGEFRTTFSWQPLGRQKKGSRNLGALGVAALGQMLRDDPTLYLTQMKKALKHEHGIRVSTSTICRAINTPVVRGGLGMSLQKLEHRALQRRYEERMRFISFRDLGDFDHKNVLVLDEASVGKNMCRRLRGYGVVGQRVRWYDNFGRKPNGTVMAACNSDGFVRRACELIMEPMDTERFIQWVDEGLVQARVLGNYVRGERNSVVMLDNVAKRHHPRVRELIEGTGAELIFLPRYRFHFYPQCFRCNASFPCESRG